MQLSSDSINVLFRSAAPESEILAKGASQKSFLDYESLRFGKSGKGGVPLPDIGLNQLIDDTWSHRLI